MGWHIIWNYPVFNTEILIFIIFIIFEKKIEILSKIIDAFARVAQWLEHRSYEPRVTGSIPVASTTPFFFYFFFPPTLKVTLFFGFRPDLFLDFRLDFLG